MFQHLLFATSKLITKHLNVLRASIPGRVSVEGGVFFGKLKKICSPKASRGEVHFLLCTAKERANKECATALPVTHRTTLIKSINSLKTDPKMNPMQVKQ